MLRSALNPYQFLHEIGKYGSYGRSSDMFELAFMVSTVGLIFFLAFALKSFLFWTFSLLIIRGLILAYLLAQVGNILLFVYEKWYASNDT